MKFCQNNLLYGRSFFFFFFFFFFEDNETQNVRFLICLSKLPSLHLSRVITATILFHQFILYSSSFVGTLENEIPGADLEPCQLKIKQFSPEILKFSAKYKYNPFTLNCSMVLRTFTFIFYASLPIMGSNSFRKSSYKEKTAGSDRVSRLFFRFL